MLIGTAMRRSNTTKRNKAPRSPRRARPSPEELVRQYEPLVRKIAGGFQRKLPRNVLREDLVGAGMTGLWDAVIKHGAERDGAAFEWYVRVRVRGAILDDLRAQDWLPRRARAAASRTDATPPVVVRLDDVSPTNPSRALVSSDASDVEAAVDTKLVRRSLEKAVEQLPERERKIVSLHYFRGMKFKDLGALLGVSEPRISQLHARAMGRLREIVPAA